MTTDLVFPAGFSSTWMMSPLAQCIEAHRGILEGAVTP